MAEKRMLIVEADLINKVDENRGDMSRSEFLNFLIDTQLAKDTDKETRVEYVNKEEFNQFAEGMKELLRNFLEFFLSYGLELGKPTSEKISEEMKEKMQALSLGKKIKTPN